MLYAHQQKIIDADPKKCGLFLGTGSGKSRIALMLSEGKTLVICPKTQKQDRNWEREAKKIYPEAHEIEVTDHGIIQHDFTITFDIFKKTHTTLPRVDTLIIDECEGMLGVTPNTRQRKHVTFPRASQRFEALQEYVARTNPSRIYLCTATITRSPMCVWGAGKILGREWDFFQFRQSFYQRLPMPGREVWVPKVGEKEKELLAKAVRSLGYVGRLSDYFDVPEQTFKDVYVDLTPTQQKRLKEIPLEYPDALVQVGKKHQIENGILNGDEFTPSQTFDNAKLDKLCDLASEFPHMIVFAKYTEQIRQIESTLSRAGYMVLTMTGETSNRGELLKKASSLPQCVFVVQAQISAGWELPEYPCMVFASRTYSVSDQIQSWGRIQRANNIKKNIYINLIARGGVDQAVNNCLSNKVDFSERVFAKLD